MKNCLNDIIIYRSEALRGDVELRIVIPKKKTWKPIEKLMILLHGKVEPEVDSVKCKILSEKLGLEDLCEKYHVLAVIPSMKNCYYISTEDYNCEKFLAEELPTLLCGKYGVSENVEKILAGVSMGGYGAVLIELNRGIFDKVVSVSGSFIVDDILLGNPEVWGRRKPTRGSTEGCFLYYFLPLDRLEDSNEKNVFAALSQYNREDNPCEFILTCGTKDWLYSRNLDFIEKLKEQGISHRFIPVQDGDHESECFREGLWEAFENMR